jgi:hypothetical protein
MSFTYSNILVVFIKGGAGRTIGQGMTYFDALDEREILLLPCTECTHH